MSLEIYTRCFGEELRTWAAEQEGQPLCLPAQEEGAECRLFLAEDRDPARDLTALLAEAALSLNPITKKNAALRLNVKNMVFRPWEAEIAGSVSDYLRENRRMDLEGFINFRMNEYTHLINLVLYMAVKKAMQP